MKQVQCNKCGKYFEVEGEWGYCPFCENDQVEVKVGNSNGDFVDLLRKELYDVVNDMFKRENKRLRKTLELLKDKNNYYEFVNEKTETIDVEKAFKIAKEIVNYD